MRVQRTTRTQWSSSVLRLSPIAMVLACSGSPNSDLFVGTGAGGTPNTIGSGTGGSGGGAGSQSAGGTLGLGGALATGGTSGSGASAGSNTGGSAASAGVGGASGDGGAGPAGGSQAIGGSSATGGSGAGSGGSVGGTDMTGTGGATGGSSGVGGTSGATSTGGGGSGAGGSSAGGSGGTSSCGELPEACDGVDNNCTGTIDEGDDTCPSDCLGARIGSSRYLLCQFTPSNGAGNGTRDWEEALEFCNDQGMVLIQIDSEDENDLVVDWAEDADLTGAIWMGANDRDVAGQSSREGHWVWGVGDAAAEFWTGASASLGGRPVMDRYNNWTSGSPNGGASEDCGVLAEDHDWEWADRSCSSNYSNLACESK